jgi:acetylglutamate kinase
MTGREAARLIKTGTANKGMVAKLQACRAALAGGVGDVVIADGRTVRLDTLAVDTTRPRSADVRNERTRSGCTQVVR